MRLQLCSSKGQTYFAAAAGEPKVNVPVAPMAVDPLVPRSDLAEVVQTIVGVNAYTLMMAMKEELRAEAVCAKVSWSVSGMLMIIAGGAECKGRAHSALWV